MRFPMSPLLFGLALTFAGCGGDASGQDSSGGGHAGSANGTGGTAASGGTTGGGTGGDSGAPCKDGETRPADDGCNTCSCHEGGWACTEIGCLNEQACGARAGDTCSDSEFCAYVEGEHCGAADAQATCEPRPQICGSIYLPVCGCDGKSYANACTANAAGTGVNTAGECTP